MPIYEKPINSPYEVKEEEPNPRFDKDSKFNKTNYKGNFKDDNFENPYKKAASMIDANKVVDLQVFQPPPAKGPNPYTGKKPFLPIEPIAMTTP